VKFICVRCERRYTEKIGRCLTCGGQIRSIARPRPGLFAAAALFLGCSSSLFRPAPQQLPTCEKLISVSFRGSDLVYLTRAMQTADRAETYRVYEGSGLAEGAVVAELVERCP